MDDWEPIETAPKDGRTVILFRDSAVFGMALCYFDNVKLRGASDDATTK